MMTRPRRSARRKRRWRPSALLAVLLIALLPACSPAGDRPAGPPPASSANLAEGPAEGLPAGWRWESYGGVEVGVPGDWAWGNGSQRLSQWCIAEPAEKDRPLVGRPGFATLVGCGPRDSGPEPDTLVAETGTVVGFDRTTEPDGVEHRGDRTTVRRDSAEVVIQAPAEIRQRIAATVRRVTVDSNGCPVTHPVSTKPQWRPAGPPRKVTTVSVCKYETGEGRPGIQPRVISSARLDGPAAAQAIRGISRAPVGGGPNAPQTCLKEASYGDEIMVLRTGPADLVIRYSGCDHNGFDDGVTVRRLTAAAMLPFVAGPNQVLSASGSDEMVDILHLR